jgi:hypothetical protein
MANANAQPGVPQYVIQKLNERAPTCPTNAGTREIVTNRLELRQAANELGIAAYVYGPLPANATADNVTLGRRWLLSAFEDRNVRGLIATHGGPDGPSCWAWVQNNMLGGRDEQEVLHNMIEELVFDGSTTVLSFYSTFLMLSSAIQPALPPARLCIMYSSRFPAQEYMAIMTSADNAPGHNNFMTYATAVNNAVQTYHQRLQIQD